MKTFWRLLGFLRPYRRGVTVSFVLAGALVALVSTHPSSLVLRALIGVGFCGGLTTFSTWMVENVLLARDGEVGLAALYVVASREARELANRAKELIVSLSRISTELAQLVVTETESGLALPAWYTVELVRALPRIAAKQ